MIELDKLGKLPIFSDLPPERLQWLCDNLTEFTARAGDVLLAEGEVNTSLLLLLEGEVSTTRRAEGELSTQRYVAPDFFGAPALVASIPYPATLRATSDCLIAVLPETAFRNLFLLSGSFTRLVARGMTDFLAALEVSGRNREKLAALGKLSAGLAHELNNPASAVSRALDYMLDGLATLEDSALALGLHAVPRETVDALRTMAARSAMQTGVSVGDALRVSEAESRLGDWLGSHGTAKPWLAAPCLVAHGITSDDLEPLAARLNADQLDAAVSWIAQVLELRSVMHEAKRGAARIFDLVKAMKSYTFMDQGPRQEVDIHAGIEDTLTVMGHELKRGIVIMRDFDSGMPRLPAYGSELNQVWTRIIENAVEAMNGQGELTIRTRRDADRGVVEFIDSGPGIPQDAIPHLFEPFFTCNLVSQTQGQGLGMGLHVAYRIVVNRHGGTIEAASRPGETIFRVTLPLKT
ncbi:periplasmic sensor signal transduction histidine kinase [Caballeronia calidae]|uniref:histidine kinase n=1 Tax=Caballeronia calidae TaxID=1777139 RepID=A0A158EBN1_9BURK|nr:ATP-binding protein [Caballeronia calidae]SAL04292.1 periplasmic sensor signal transduction histidine kinase [Caballeronia calidae]